jgi:hypothetical protein
MLHESNIFLMTIAEANTIIQRASFEKTSLRAVFAELREPQQRAILRDRLGPCALKSQTRYD